MLEKLKRQRNSVMRVQRLRHDIWDRTCLLLPGFLALCGVCSYSGKGSRCQICFLLWGRTWCCFITEHIKEFLHWKGGQPLQWAAQGGDNAWQSFLRGNSCWCPAWASPGTVWGCFPLSCSSCQWVPWPELGDPHPRAEGTGCFPSLWVKHLKYQS